MPIRPAAQAALCLACLAALPPAARADAPDLRVVVAATRSDTRLADMPMYATVITSEQIRNSPAQTLDQLLRQVPGINLPGAPYYVTDPTGNQIRMRGTTNSKVLVMVDGIPVLDPFYTTVQWFKVPLSSIEKVEIVRGGNSSLWGNLAVAGVVNIVTRKPRDGRGGVTASYGSRNTGAAAAAKDVDIAEGIGFNLSADAFATDGYQTTPAQYLATFPGKAASSATIWNARFAAYYNPAPDLSAFVRGGYHEQDQDIGGYTFGTNLQRSPDVAGGLTKDFGDAGRLAANLWTQYVGFDKSNGAGCFLQSATNCNTTAASAPLVQYANSRDWNPYRELGASAVYTMALPAYATTMQVGADYRQLFGQDYATTYNRPTTTDVASATVNRTNFGQGQQQFTGAFAQFRWTPLDPVQVTLSARYDYWTNTEGVSSMVRYVAGNPGPQTGGAVPDSHKGQFDPTLALRYSVNDEVDVRGAAYKSFRAPGLNNLYRTFSSTTSITIANPLLFPETLTGGEVGMDWRAPGREVNATMFIYDIENLIASYRVTSAATAPPQVIAICGPTLANCPANVNFNTNAQNGRSWGLELAGRLDVTPAISINAAYLFTRSYYTWSSVGDPLGNQLGAVPTNLFTAGVNWQVTPEWRTFAGVRWTGGMYLDVAHTIPQGGFAVVDVSTSYRVQDDFEVYASIANLLDEKYSDNATTSASSSTLGLPFTLTAGLRWRF
ncbi:MAG: TonB-dependent receptor [Burkholderiales bacterium]